MSREISTAEKTCFFTNYLAILSNIETKKTFFFHQSLEFGWPILRHDAKMDGCQPAGDKNSKSAIFYCALQESSQTNPVF